mmetsp:Transcript_24737/g.60779  ORF Transcript_24737/g.60779 Transcript_24737/m.60779 type:complete len:99 (-) Transcript_24737:101-397(-)
MRNTTMSYQSLDFCKYERLRNSTQLPSPYQPATVPHKSMFSSDLNLTKSGMDCMMDAGLMKELTRQGDGSEWMTDKEGWGTRSLQFHAQGQGGRWQLQ